MNQAFSRRRFPNGLVAVGILVLQLFSMQLYAQRKITKGTEQVFQSTEAETVLAITNALDGSRYRDVAS